MFITDLGSTNGTRVNGALVREQISASGDEVSVGSTKLIFEDDVRDLSAWPSWPPRTSTLCCGSAQWGVIALIFLFFLRVVRAVFVEMSPATIRKSRADKRLERAAARPARSPTRRKQLYLRGGGAARSAPVRPSTSTTS